MLRQYYSFNETRQNKTTNEFVYINLKKLEKVGCKDAFFLRGITCLGHENNENGKNQT